MGVKYAPGIDLTAIRDGQTDVDYSWTMTITGAGTGSGYTPLAMTAADFDTANSHLLMHSYAIAVATNHEGNTVFGSYSTASFANALTVAMNAKMLTLAVPWVGSFLVTFANGVYTVAQATGTFTFTIAWGQSASRWLMGFAADQSTPGTTFTGTLTPNYWIDATLDGRSMDQEDDYEESSIAGISISDDATAFAGVSRSTAPKLRAWFQHFEPVAKVCKAKIAGTVRWTFEHLFEHCRCEFPFVVDDGVDQMVCVFMPDGSVWRGKTRPGGPGDAVHFHVPFKVWHAADVVGE